MVTQIPLRVREASKQIGAWSQAMGRQVQAHPGRSVALAVGAGYLLGGGLFSRLTFRVVGTGMRIGLRLLVPYLTQTLVADHLNPNKENQQ